MNNMKYVQLYIVLRDKDQDSMNDFWCQENAYIISPPPLSQNVNCDDKM